jgi:hypothetical protein
MGSYFILTVLTLSFLFSELTNEGYFRHCVVFLTRPQTEPKFDTLDRVMFDSIKYLTLTL